MLSKVHLSFIVIAALCLAGCKEDLTPIKKAWSDTEAGLNAKLSAAKKAAGDLRSRYAQLGDLPSDDVKGKELKGKADEAVSAIEKTISDAEGALKSAEKSVAAAITTGKSVTVKDSIDKGKAAFDGAINKLGELPKNAEDALDALKKHSDELMAAATAKAARQPPTTDAHKEGPYDFPGLDFVGKTDKLNLADEAVKANLVAVAALINRCDAIKGEIQGHVAGDNPGKTGELLSKKRADAVKVWLVKQGKVKATKISKTSGLGTSEPLELEPKDDLDKQKIARAHNERIRVKIVKACPKGK